MSDGQYLYAERDGTLFIKLAGELRYQSCMAFEAFLQKALATPGLRDAVVDLTEALYIDSTNLGLIAKVANHFMRTLNRKPTLISLRPDITRLLRVMGFNSAFHIVESAPEDAGGGMAKMPDVQGSDRQRIEAMLEAHKRLIALDAANEPVFRAVVDFLQRDADRLSGRA